MAYPVVENIAVNVEDTLRGVQLDAGYNNDLTVLRSPRKFDPADSLCVLRQLDSEKLDGLTDDAAAGNEGVIFWKQHFEAVAYVVESQSSTTPIDTRINSIRSDIEKALMQDTSRGGNAHYTTIDAPTVFQDAAGTFTGIAVNFNVQYATRGNDPYVAAPG